MRTICLLAVFCVVGCSQKPAPIVAAKKIETTQPKVSEISEKAPPSATDQAARALVDAALKAHFAGKPEQVNQWKSFKLVRTGPVRTPSQEIIPQQWTIEARWHDGYKLRADVGGNSVIISVLGNTARRCNIITGQRTPTEVLDPPSTDDFRQDTAGEWLWSLYPLTVPETKLTLDEPTTFQNKQLLGVRVFHPQLLPVIVYFDPDTKLLTGVTYQGRENGMKVYKENYALDYQEFKGMKYPKRSFVNANSLQLAEWNTISMEPANYPTTFFETP